MCSSANTPQPPPTPPTIPHSIWAHVRGRYWSAKIDDITLLPPVCYAPANCKTGRCKYVAYYSKGPELDEIIPREASSRRVILQNDNRRILLTMNQILEVEENPFTSSLNISPKKPAFEGGGGGVTPPYHHPWTNNYKDTKP
jgi:hypothetical protein